MYFILLIVVFYVSRIDASREFLFNSLVSFGDSNTDTDNVYNLTHGTWPIVPPYYRGRFSDGPVWIEMLGVADIHNYAYGGATSDNNLIQGYTASDTRAVPGVRQQIQLYLNETQNRERDFQRTLFIVWVGGDDYYFNQTLKPSVVVKSILNAVEDLLRLGVKHLLVVNRSPFEVMPFVRDEEQMNSYRRMSHCHNGNLSLGLKNLAYNRREVSVYLFDVHSLVLLMVNNDSFGFSHKKDSCWTIINGQIEMNCSNPESYIFIDQYHFTTRAHQYIAEAVRQLVINSSMTICSSSLINVVFLFCVTMMKNRINSFVRW